MHGNEAMPGGFHLQAALPERRYELIPDSIKFFGLSQARLFLVESDGRENSHPMLEIEMILKVHFFQNKNIGGLQSCCSLHFFFLVPQLDAAEWKTCRTIPFSSV